MRKNKRWVMGLIALFGGMTGCRPASVGLGPFPAAAPAHPAGLRYSLGRDLVVIEAVVSEYVETRIAPLDGKRLKAETSTGVVPVKIGISLKTTADPNFVYTLDLSARDLSDGSMEIRVGDNGLLTSIEAESRSRAGEVLIQVARLAGEVAGAAAGWRGPGTKDERPGASGRRERRLESLSREALYFLQESAAARELWREVDRVEEDLAACRTGLRDYTDSAAAAADSSRFSLAEKRAAFVEKSIQFLEKQAEKARTAFSAALRNYLAAEGIGRATRDRTVIRHLDLLDLPPSTAVFGAVSDEAVAAALERDFPRALALYRETGCVVAFDPDVPLQETPDPVQKTEPRRNEVRFYFREALPGFLRLFTWQDRADSEKKDFDRVFRLAEEKPATVLHPGLPVRYVGFHRKAFSSRTLRLAVNGQGRVVGLSSSASSSLNAAAAGAVSALDALRETVSETWKEVRRLVEALGRLSLDDLEARLSRLKIQAERIGKEPDSADGPGRKDPGA
ncbi:MAG: hypothetical protein JW843_08070 [Candidatus Aminicenantes bacterium]|nr:hypothetical protein [Candidatus Aminicenantes bacterium]